MSKNLEQRVAELEREVKALKGQSAIKTSKKLGIGDTFELAGLTWKILDITEKGYLCLADRLEDGMKFDSDCNNWQSSDLRNYLNIEIFKRIAGSVAEDNIIEFERNLLSLDGQTEYGTCEDKVSLLTVDEYRKYRKLISNERYWWWLISPWSTPCNGYDSTVAVVSPSGGIYGYGIGGANGVRPICIFSSAIFESEE